MTDNVTLTTQIIQFIIAGITIGSIYAMVAIGFNIVYNVTQIINFAQGEFVVLGGLVMFSFHVTLQVPAFFAALLTIGLVMILGLVLDRFAIRPIKKPNVLTLITATIAASFIFKGGAMLLWGKDFYDVPAFSGREPINFFGAVIQPQSLWIIGVLIVTVVVLTLFFEKSIIGKAMIACSNHADAASLLGINVKRMILISFAISAAIGALAGLVITPMSLMDYDRGAMMAVKGFGAVILGGLGSFPGAILGGMILGLIEALGAGFISSGYKDAFALIVLLIALIFKPGGILGNMEANKLKKF